MKDQENKLFREEALDQLSSRLPIDTDVKVTKPSVFVIIGTMLSILLAIIAWGIFGTISDTEQMNSVVFPVAGTQEVSLPNRGTVRSLFVHEGDKVYLGQTLAIVSVEDAYSMISAPVTGTLIGIADENDSFEAFEPVATVLGEDAGAVRTLVGFVAFDIARQLSPGMRVEVTPNNLSREENGYVVGHITEVANYPISKDEASRKLKTETLAEDIFPKSGAAFEIKMEMHLAGDGSLDWSFHSDENVDMSIGTFCKVQVVTKKSSIYKHLFKRAKAGYRKAKMSLQ